ncbi:MAG: LapA family protein [Desulfatirhabdiaceae bacterium]
MKKIKLIALVLAIGFIAMVFYQNRSFLMIKSNFHIDLYVSYFEYSGISNAVLLAGFFLIGLLIAYFSGLSNRFKSNKTIKDLNAAIASQQQTINSLKSEIDSLHGRTAQTTEIVETVSDDTLSLKEK